MAATRPTHADSTTGPVSRGLAVLEHDPATGRLRCSREAGSILGLLAGECPTDAAALLELVHPDDRAVARELLAGEHDADAPVRLGWPDGSPHRVIISARRADARTLLVLRSVAAEDDPGPALFRSLADTVPVLIWVADPWGAIQFLNEAWSAYTGRPADEQFGDGWLAAVHPDDVDAVTAAWEHARAVAGGGPFEVRYRLRAADGSYRWFQDHGRPYQLADRTPGGWVGGLVDVQGREVDLARADLLAEIGVTLEQAHDEPALLDGLVHVCAGRLGAWARVELGTDGDRRTAAAAGPGADGAAHRTVALRVGSRVLGTLALGPAVGTSGLDDPALAIEVGRRAGLALDHARLFRESRRQQRRSEEARALLDALVESAPVGFAQFDDELRFLRVNGAMAAMTGLPEDEHLGRTIGEVLPELDPRMAADLAEVLRTGVPIDDVPVSGVMPGAPGQRHFLASSYRVELPDGEALGLGLTLVDVTDRLDADRALRAQRDLYEALLRAQSEAGEAFLLLLDDLRPLYVNEAAERMLARSADELYALGSLLDVVADGDRDRVAAQLALVRDGGLLPSGFEAALVAPSGMAVDVELAARAMTGTEADRRVVLLARDVSERKRAEAERERLLEAERAARAEAEAARGRSAFLAEVSGALERSLSLEDTLHEVVGLLARDVCDITSIWVPERDGHLVRRLAAASRDPERVAVAASLAEHALPITHDHPACRVLRTGERIDVPDFGPEHLREAAANDSEHEKLAEIGPRSVVTMPLVARGRAVGALVLAWETTEGCPTDPEQVSQLDELARRVGLFIDNALLYAERAHIASTLQASLLPPALPEIPGLDVAARYLPAGEAAEVGGDFYDVFRAGVSGWAFAVGDVCGKGAEAAAVTAMARYTLRAAVADDVFASPAHAFDVLNRSMLAEAGPLSDRFLTAVMGCLHRDGDDGERRLVLTGGGHPAPILVRPGEAPRALSAPGTLLGVRSGATWTEHDVVLRRGDALVLYTDGVTEADRRRPLEAEELAELIGEAPAPATAAGLADLVRAIAEQRADGPLRDDVAIVALRLIG